jgi:XisH protein
MPLRFSLHLHRGSLSQGLSLAVPQDAYYSVFSEPLGQLIITRESLRLLIFDQIAEVLVQWNP